jgi:hypothetical protein
MDLSKIFIDNKYQIFTPDNNNKPIIIFINYTDNNVFDIIEKYSNKSIEFVVDSFYKNKIDDYNKNIIYLENYALHYQQFHQLLNYSLSAILTLHPWSYFQTK